MYYVHLKHSTEKESFFVSSNTDSLKFKFDSQIANCDVLFEPLSILLLVPFPLIK